MKWLLAFLVLYGTSLPAGAEPTPKSAIMRGGTSPDGNYEVRLTESDVDDEGSFHGYEIILCRSGLPGPIQAISPAGGYLEFAAAQERLVAVWHAESRFVAVQDQGTKRTQHIHVFWISEDGRVEQLEIPDYVQNALGRVGTVSTDSACLSTPQRWDSDILLVKLYFTVSDEVHGKHRVPYSTDVGLVVSGGRRQGNAVDFPSVRIKSIDPPSLVEN